MPRYDPARDELFLKTLEDLHRRVDDGSSNYDLLMASALIRELLLDGGSSLVHQVNRSRQLRIVYCFMELLPPADHPIPGVPPPSTLALGGAFDGLEGAPEIMYMHRVVGKESRMLGATVMIVDGTRVSRAPALSVEPATLVDGLSRHLPSEFVRPVPAPEAPVTGKGPKVRIWLAAAATRDYERCARRRKHAQGRRFQVRAPHGLPSMTETMLRGMSGTTGTRRSWRRIGSRWRD